MIYLVAYTGLILIKSTEIRGFYYPVLGALFLFSAYRFEVGCDWSGYLSQYNAYNSWTIDDILETQEILWIGLFQPLYRYDLPYPWINVFSSAIFFAGVHVLARRQPDPLAFLILLFPVLILNMPMSGIRQGAAIGVICIAFVAFSERQLLRYLLWVFVASALHSSAIVFLLLAPLVTGGYSIYRVALALFLAVPGAYVLSGTEAIETASIRYIGTEIDAYGGMYRVGLLVLAAGFFLIFLRRPWAATFPRDFKIVMIGSLIMMAMIAVLPLSSVIADRLGYYLIPIQTMIFARIAYLPIGYRQKAVAYAPYLGLLFVLVVWSSISWHFQVCYLPYRTWLFGFPENEIVFY